MLTTKSRESPKIKAEGVPSRTKPKLETPERVQANPLWQQLATRVQANRGHRPRRRPARATTGHAHHSADIDRVERKCGAGDGDARNQVIAEGDQARCRHQPPAEAAGSVRVRARIFRTGATLAGGGTVWVRPSGLGPARARLRGARGTGIDYRRGRGNAGRRHRRRVVGRRRHGAHPPYPLPLARTKCRGAGLHALLWFGLER